ncbi:hypothetical protein LXL04_000472 [Taraxacum kok-saghyz]
MEDYERDEGSTSLEIGFWILDGGRLEAAEALMFQHIHREFEPGRRRRLRRLMESVEDFETIDIELDELLTRKPTQRCQDSFLNTLCEEEVGNLEEGIPEEEEDAVNNSVEEENHEDNSEEEEGIEAFRDDEEDTYGEAEEAKGIEFTTHDPKTKWNKMIPCQGERYENPHQLKLSLTNYAVSKGYAIKFKKSDNVRVVAVCASEPKYKCPYYVRGSWMNNERSFQIKIFVGEHTCVRNYKIGKLMNPTWLARQFLKELKIVESKFHCKVSWAKCYRAKCRAMSLIEGKLTDHYSRIWDYAQELNRSNPGSTITVCFKAIKDGWKLGCRRVIGLDGAFLKGQCKGELLTAIGRDANNQVYPIAWAVVNIENKDNWSWFLNLLAADLQLDSGKDMCVISDQHKGLLEATKEILPLVEHRQCARHIYANFRKAYSGLELKKMFWDAAKSTVEGEFKVNMERIREVNQDAYAHLMARAPRSWCRAFFNTGLACEAVENGMAECFNAIIVDARKKPLLTMLEEIRLYIMARFFNLKEAADKWPSEVCPGAVKKMNFFGECLRNWLVHPSGAGMFEVRNGFQSYGVDLQQRNCACRLWSISGIPCVHAQAAIIFTQQDPKEFINTWYSKEKYLAAYSCNIMPVNGSSMWVETTHPKPLPPISRRMPGRPSIKRKRHVSEHDDKHSQVSSKKWSVQCKNCLVKGHNARSCKNPKVVPQPKPKGKMGRPRLDPNLNHWTRGGRGPKRGGRGMRGRGEKGESNRGESSRVQDDFTQGSVPYDDFTQFLNENVDFKHDVQDAVPEHDVHDVQDVQDAVPEHDVHDVQVVQDAVPEHDVHDVQDVQDEGDGMDISDMDELINQIRSVRESGYTDEVIMNCVGISASQLKELDEIVASQEKLMVDVAESQSVPETQPLGHEEGIGETVDESLPDSQVMKKLPVRRKPSQRITKMKLKKHVVDKQGRGMSAEKPLALE